MLQGSDEAVMEQDGGRRGAVLCAEVGRRLEVAVLEQWRLEPSAARRHACEEERERRCSRDCVGYVGLGPFWIETITKIPLVKTKHAKIPLVKTNLPKYHSVQFFLAKIPLDAN
jgi:hypothetical protein